VALNDDGEIVEYRPDGTTSVVDVDGMSNDFAGRR